MCPHLLVIIVTFIVLITINGDLLGKREDGFRILGESSLRLTMLADLRVPLVGISLVAQPAPSSPAERRCGEEGRHRQDAAGGEDGALLPARGTRVGLAPPHQPAAMLLLLRRARRVRPPGVPLPPLAVAGRLWADQEWEVEYLFSGLSNLRRNLDPR